MNGLRLYAILGVLCLTAGIGSAIEPVNPDLSEEGREVLDYLESIYGENTLAGYNMYVHTPDVYEQTARHGAIWSGDLRWMKPEELSRQTKKFGYILSIHWHWDYRGDLRRKSVNKDLDVGRMSTPGTEEYRQTMVELAEAAEKLQIFEDEKVPVLFRPLHEIDGGWFFWTDKENPENTANLWRMMYHYFTDSLEIDNLIWVYSAGVPLKKTVEFRKGFYPGDEYVDISGIDIYHIDYDDSETYQAYFDTMSLVTPGKMLALSECGGNPNPDQMQDGSAPRWLYSLPWWGTPSGGNSLEWATYTMNHEYLLTLDEIPAFGTENNVPAVGITDPLDDGSAVLENETPVITAYAVDRDGTVERVDFTANDSVIGTLTREPYVFTWNNAPRGSYDIKVTAYDNEGGSQTSNNVRIVVGFENVALGKPVVASSDRNEEGSVQKAVDGDSYTNWSSAKTDDEWIYVDLDEVYTIGHVNILWGWKIHGEDFTIDIATESPDNESSWETVYTAVDMPYITWKATHRCRFDPVEARYVRVHATDRPGKQEWSGYTLTELQVLHPVEQTRVAHPASPSFGMAPGNKPAERVFYDIRGRLITSPKHRSVNMRDAVNGVVIVKETVGARTVARVR